MTTISLRPTLCILWFALVLYGELGTFVCSLADCTWPEDSPHTASTHVLVIADPQILDMQSYPDRPWVLQWISRLMTDLNMRKSWWATRRHLKPDVLVFLGDMMDRGRIEMPQVEYEAYVARFRSIFAHTAQERTFYLPGNHDVGLAGYGSSDANQRYKSTFGTLNRVLTIANHSVVLINAPGLVDEDAKRLQSGQSVDGWKWPFGGAFDYISRVAPNLDVQYPVVLFTHIPLHRPRGSSCGSLRERGTIRQGRGVGYQNTLGEEVSKTILQLLKPSIVLSGDDHDYCEYMHTTSMGHSVREITVKSFSMAMGVHRPGFQLLSLSGNASPPTHADTSCLLPDQISIFVSLYAPVAGLSIILLFISNILRMRHMSVDRGIADDNYQEAYDLLPRHASDPMDLDTQHHRDQIRLRCCGFGALSWFKTTSRPTRGMIRRRGFLLDLRDVAWPPLVLFVCINLLTFVW